MVRQEFPPATHTMAARVAGERGPASRMRSISPGRSGCSPMNRYSRPHPGLQQQSRAIAAAAGNTVFWKRRLMLKLGMQTCRSTTYILHPLRTTTHMDHSGFQAADRPCIFLITGGCERCGGRGLRGHSGRWGRGQLALEAHSQPAVMDAFHARDVEPCQKEWGVGGGGIRRSPMDKKPDKLAAKSSKPSIQLLIHAVPACCRATQKASYANGIAPSNSHRPPPVTSRNQRR
jgi:hypothetical protein